MGLAALHIHLFCTMHTRRQLFRQAGAIGLLASFAPGLAMAAPRADLWPHWQAHDPDSTHRIDHSTWAAFLNRYLSQGSDGINRIDYRAALNARGGLHGYMQELEAVPVSRLNRDEQFAYWVNLYNALTVATVMDHYPVDTIRDIDISSGLFSNGPWGAALVEVEAMPLTLDDIEHRILRPIWRDARVHYAVNCAALGCPNLYAEPFYAGRLDQQLDDAARDFVNHPRGARIEEGELYVSSIYDWFESDFGGSEMGVINHLKRFAEPGLAAQLNDITEIEDHGYDWLLNDSSAAGQS